jgi:hypothetical protein
MEINLESDVELASSFKAIYNVLRATMEYPAGAQAKAKKLADDIAFFVSSAPGDPPFWEICPIIIELASRLPPDHKWQASLVQSIHILSELDKSPLRGSNVCVKMLSRGMMRNNAN